ncbi:ATP-binding protein [Serratia quinivorans]|uniref:ATP-binding protein n=1 Tax=Serratia quinivorans TaxID=137545 RepID=UPI0021BDE7B2|nr:transporter substrate-binding domain-containing protein [Serratia quinivorans]
MKFIFNLFILLSTLLVSPFSNARENQTVSFTPAEKNYIRNNPVIRYGAFSSLYPIESMDNQQGHIGLTNDYIVLISQSTGIHFQEVKISRWKDAISNLENHDIALATAISSAYDGKKKLAISTPYFTTWPTMITRKSSSYISDLSDIREGYIAVSDNLSLDSWLKEKYNDLPYKTTSSAEEAIQQVVKQQAVAAIVTSPIAYYMRDNLYYEQLRLQPYYDKKFELSMAATKENALLISIINKVLSSLSEKTKNDITLKWIVNQKNESLYKYGLVSIGLLTTLSVILLFFNIRLRKKTIAIKKNTVMDLSIATHEMRTPLVAVLSACESLSLSLQNAAHKERMSDIIAVVKPLLDTLDLSLDYAKTCANKTQIKREALLLADICDSTIKTFSDFSQQQNTTLSIRYESVDCFLPHFIDAALITQALNNVLNNAIKYTHSGMIIVECSTVHMDSKKMFCIEVSDTGIGIPPGLLVELTEPYTQAENDIPEGMPKGTGLGLFIVKKNLQLLDGHLVIVSKPGVGSRLKLVFPILSASSTEIALFQKNFRTVIAEQSDDEAENELRRIFLTWGIDVEMFSSAKEANNTITLQLSQDKKHWQLSYHGQKNSELSRTPLYASDLYRTICNLIAPLSEITSPLTLELKTIAFTGVRLLLIEDEPLLRRVQEENFSAMGFQVDAVANAQSAYQHWLAYKHPIIVTDCRLDESDGFELAARLNQLAQHQGVEPLLIIGQTASIKDTDHLQAQASGMILLLQKPVANTYWQNTFLTYLNDR